MTFADWTTRAAQLLPPLYQQPHRHYHALPHIEALLHGLETHQHLALDPGRVRLAIWFHDAVYDTTRHDNEEQSAALAERCLAEWGVSPSVVASVAAMVRATAKHEWLDGDSATALFLDLDLGVLAAAPDAYDRYAAQVAQEYSWVPQQMYRSGRAKILRAFLDRPRIYFTEELATQWEDQARANLSRELHKLAADA